MSTKTPTTVITGFLGAGKTTMIRHILENAEGQRIALIINEFGDLGVDGEILSGCGIEGCEEGGIVELSNGCICCTVAEEFTPAIRQLLGRDPKPDHIIVETSGLAIPQPLVRAFNWPEVRTQVTVDGVVAVVDGPAAVNGQFAHDLEAVEKQRQADENLDHESPLAELFDDQLACADLVVVNKSDLLGQKASGEFSKKLQNQVRDGVKVVSAQMGAVDPKVLLGLGFAAELNMESRAEIHHVHGEGDHKEEGSEHDEFESFVVELTEASNVERLVDGVRRVMSRHDLLRVKGFAAIAGKPMRMVIQAVGPRVDGYFDRPFRESEPRMSRLVVIGLAGIERSAVETDLLKAVA